MIWSGEASMPRSPMRRAISWRKRRQSERRAVVGQNRTIGPRQRSKRAAHAIFRQPGRRQPAAARFQIGYRRPPAIGGRPRTDRSPDPASVRFPRAPEAPPGWPRRSRTRGATGSPLRRPAGHRPRPPLRSTPAWCRQSDRIDGSLSPGVRLRPAMRCRIAAMTVDRRVLLLASSLIRIASDTITVLPNCTGLSLGLPAATIDKVRSRRSFRWTEWRAGGSMDSSGW